MSEININKKLKDLRNKKGYSLEAISEMIPVSKQGYHMWEQGMRAWKIDVLTKLTGILDFQLILKDGNLEIIENREISENTEIAEIRNNLNILKVEEEIYNMNNLIKVGMKLEGYSIIELYTGSININFEEQEILEPCMIYSTKEEAVETFNSDSIVPVYALLNEETGNVNPNTYGLDKTRAYSMYFWNYAPIIGKENTVYINLKQNIKVSRGFVKFDIKNQNLDGSYPILNISHSEESGTLGMFLVTDINGFIIPQMDYATMDFPNILK